MQWDFAVHRDFPSMNRLKLQFRAEMFNVLNHPNFGRRWVTSPTVRSAIPPKHWDNTSAVAAMVYGLASGLSPLYQIGGPRSIQLALKLLF